MAALALERQHRVDHMLQHARAGDRTVLGDMADQHQRRAALLGEADQFLRGGADLADRAGRALDQVGVHRLDRIDDEQRGRPPLPQRRQDIADRGGGGELHRRPAQPQPPRAQPHLIRRFLARDIGDMRACQRHLRRRLEQQGRLADPRITADQRRRAFDETAAQRPVQLRDAARQPRGQRDLRVQPDQRDRAPAALQIMLGLERRDDRRRLLDQRVPLGAIEALALPPRRDRAAGLANETLLYLGHATSLTEAER